MKSDILNTYNTIISLFIWRQAVLRYRKLSNFAYNDCIWNAAFYIWNRLV